MQHNLLEFFKSNASNRLFGKVIFVIGLIVLSLITNKIYSGIKYNNSDPITIMVLLIAAIMVFLFISILAISSQENSFISFFVQNSKKRVSKLRKRIIIAFSIGTAVPAILIAIFSIYFFNISVQTWFDKKVTTVLDQSVSIGEKYVDRNIIQLKETTISVANDLNEMYYDLIQNYELFNKVINAQAEMRSIDEAMVFQRSTNTILAQTALSFSLPFTTIQSHLIERANAGEVVQIPSDITKVRMLVKLQDYNDTYLLLGRLVDHEIIEHINKAEGAVSEYKRVKQQISMMQIKFLLVFIAITIFLVILGIIGGKNFAERLVKPIKELVIAAEKVKNGDLSVQVPDSNMRKDELKVLASAFNRMIKQIDRQQKELLVAQRALAWSDVARQVAHEIKNPLTPIQLSATRLHSKFMSEVSDKESFEKYINNILRHSNNIKTIVSEFVNFARLPAPNFVKCEIVSMISDLLDPRRLINDKITYTLSCNKKVIDFACDITLFQQIMENLLQNAEDALSGKIKDPQISIDINLDGSILTIIISDNGPGIPLDIIDKVTVPYVTSKEKGTGLGLAIVERLVHDHFGLLEITNNKNGGAVAKLKFDREELKEKLKD